MTIDLVKSSASVNCILGEYSGETMNGVRIRSMNSWCEKYKSFVPHMFAKTENVSFSSDLNREPRHMI